METAYMVMFGRYTDTIRHFKSADDAYDFIVEIVRKTRQIHHKSVGAQWIQIQASHGSANVYEVYFDVNKVPKRFGKARMREEFEKRGLSKNGSFWE